MTITGTTTFKDYLDSIEAQSPFHERDVAAAQLLQQDLILWGCQITGPDGERIAPEDYFAQEDPSNK